MDAAPVANLEVKDVEASLEKKDVAKTEAKAIAEEFELGVDFHVTDWVSIIYGSIGEFIGMILFLYFNIAAILGLNPTVFAGADTATPVLQIAFQFGLSIFLLVYVFGQVSGGHMNPAVTFGLMCAKKCTFQRAVCYVIAQCVGATIGSGIAKGVYGDDNYTYNGSEFAGANSVNPAIGKGGTFGAEVMGTYLLVLTVFMATNATVNKKVPFIGALLPFAIGMAVTIAHIALVPIDGCSINPARSFGAAAVSGLWDDQWVFWIGPLVGGFLAAASFELVIKRPVERTTD